MRTQERGPQIDVADVVAGGLILAGLYKMYRTASRMCMEREQAAAQRGFEQGRNSDIRLQLDDWMVKLNQENEWQKGQTNAAFKASLDQMIADAREEGRQEGRQEIIKELN